MSDHPYSKNPRALILAIALGMALAGGAHAVGPLLSANPHAPDLSPGPTPPLAGIAALSQTALNAYHVGSDAEVVNALGYIPYGKAKILSDQVGGTSVSRVEGWIRRTCDPDGNGRFEANGEHYEHRDAELAEAAMGGAVIDSLDDFPEAGREILRFIRDESCASELESPGRLTREGTELAWNGRPVTLVGYSWLGALASRNADFEGYLDVLAAHRVNLTRVRLIDQWTALLTAEEGAPRSSTGNLPFAGAIDFAGAGDTLDLMRIEPAFLDRLAGFVDAAAARGIVVQITLFDRPGLLRCGSTAPLWSTVEPSGGCAGCPTVEFPCPAPGTWDGSPYNRANNRNGILVGGATGKAPPAFLGTMPPLNTDPPPDSIAASHLTLVGAVVHALAGKGNVLLEIMNEPVAEEWGGPQVTEWHRWIAQFVHGG